jgi:hypothetical protein
MIFLLAAKLPAGTWMLPVNALFERHFSLQDAALDCVSKTAA